MTFRNATKDDIKQMFAVRMSVKENILYNTDLVTDAICEEYIIVRGKGWVCEIDDTIVGFAIADLVDKSVWALFVHPEYESMSIGKQLQNIMLNWYFTQSGESVWLTTVPGTRAEIFYRNTGWKETGRNKNGEIRFELTKNDWQKPKK